MWLMVIISTLCVCGGYALGYTHGCSWDLPQVPGDMCLVQELGCQVGVPVRCKKGFGGFMGGRVVG